MKKILVILFILGLAYYVFRRALASVKISGVNYNETAKEADGTFLDVF